MPCDVGAGEHGARAADIGRGGRADIGVFDIIDRFFEMYNAPRALPAPHAVRNVALWR